MRTFLILTLFLSTNVITRVSTAQSSTSNKNDFQVFRKALRETHPALYRFTPKERFDMVFDSIDSKLIHSSGDLQLFRGLSKVMSLVREGHSYVSASDDLERRTRNKSLFPFNVVVNENRMVIRKSRSHSYVELGKAEITSINGQSIPAILSAIAASTGIKSAFNNGAMESTLSEYSNFAFAYHYFIDTTSTFTITYRVPPQQKEYQTTVQGTTDGLEDETYPRMPAEPVPPMHFQIDAENAVAIMKITTFAYWVVNKSIKDYSDFFEESFEKLKEQNIKHLIIDIRNNRGGEEMIGAELLTYFINTDFKIYKFGKAGTLDFSYTNKLPKSNKIKLPKKHYLKTDSGYILQKGDVLRSFQPKTNSKFRGQVYVLSNNRCWSAANSFLALVKSHQAATIIGQESGGSFQDVDGRQRVSFELPYSKMKVSYPVWSFRIDSKGGDRLRGVVPDHIITRDTEDLISEKDVELDFTYHLIKNQ